MAAQHTHTDLPAACRCSKKRLFLLIHFSSPEFQENIKASRHEHPDSNSLDTHLKFKKEKKQKTLYLHSAHHMTTVADETTVADALSSASLNKDEEDDDEEDAFVVCGHLPQY